MLKWPQNMIQQKKALDDFCDMGTARCPKT